MRKRSLGICLGAASIKAVELIEEQGTLSIGEKVIRNHESNPRQIFADLIEDLNIDRYDFFSITGRKFKQLINTHSITEPEAIENALSFLKSGNSKRFDFTAVASLGAENFIIYLLDQKGNISTVGTGNKCASGTGDFFFQQIRRMNISPDDALKLANEAQLFFVSGRCSVFCKSDCTHALNKGIPIGNVTAGLCHMMAEKILDLLDKLSSKKILAVGGVTKNTVVMNLLREKVDFLYIPDSSDVFEALGAAYFAWRHKIRQEIDRKNIFRNIKTSFSFLPSIEKSKNLVEFKEVIKAKAKDGDECILGLDVGSTTTKAVLLRIEDNAILLSVYLRTLGNPIDASRRCYKELSRKIDKNISVTGLAVTGSGRQIAGLHASTDTIYNEIIAHATGAAYFDREVDTIFEIGGQDAKYTLLTNEVPSDYAMNEACSAGTGSFLEESALESLGIDYLDIEEYALRAQIPPNFNDQCAAFINSDIKTATNEGIGKDDIVAGLVYSICFNYVNRVKGQRPIGKKVFMQGGVCYNKAVPLAMANLIEQPIVVPPDPGLIGAFGIALELKNRINKGLAKKQQFDLNELSERDITYGKDFICQGKKENCDRGCTIKIMIINGRKYPFGGACNKYYNQVHHMSYNQEGLNQVKSRQMMLFSDYSQKPKKGQYGRAHTQRIGLSRSFLTNTFFPLFYNFFVQLGYNVILSDDVDSDGIKKKRSSFCYPAEIAHGCFENLRKKELDYIFLPKIMGLHVEKSVNKAKQHQSTCVLLQSEAYYLKSAFNDLKNKAKTISPILDFSTGLDSQQHIFVEVARKMGHKKRVAIEAYQYALSKQQIFSVELKQIGNKILKTLESEKQDLAIVLFGRPYNAFASEANKGIPNKFASRGVLIIPWEYLPFEDEYCQKDMCWAIGQNILKAARFVKRHPQLFGVYITNFSCGPDSFLIGQFRDIMETKPSLTLELDSHTADAGINTRIEAFLDIVKRYIAIEKKDKKEKPFNPAKIVLEGNIPYFITKNCNKYPFYSRRVHVLIPSMGPLGSELLASAFRGIGVKSTAVPKYDFEVMKLGRANASCKECLPLLLLSGALLRHLKYRKDNDELLAYFIPFTPGSCRFPQYRVFLKNLIQKKRIENVTLFSLSAEKGYISNIFTSQDRLNFLKSIIVSDVMEDIKNSLTVLAIDKEKALETFFAEWAKIIELFEKKQIPELYSELEKTAATLIRIPLKYPLSKAKKVSILGELFVRRDYFSSQDLIKRLAVRNIIVKKTHFFEWLKYIDFTIKKKIYEPNFDLRGKIRFALKVFLQDRFEKRIKHILSQSGLYEYEPINIKNILDYGQNFFDIRFRGESILAVGGFFKEILHDTHGVISVGPFACMPTRVIESILTAESTLKTKLAMEKDRAHLEKKFDGVLDLPFLSIESDGNAFPQIVEAKIEAFCFQLERIYQKASSLNTSSN